ncbi:helix-turn-helix transcriptional regulator [Clostridium minihomine]|uniref:helix-turn-helix transcriptional regulator n=1 Tax=Clostridium minihomine TaxID=2045012 RepID=UPI000C759420|nr:AraC family transcriptional regulator [Clostridium minihomine]
MEPQLDLAIDCTYADSDMPIQQLYFNVYRQIYIKRGKIRLTVNGVNYIVSEGYMLFLSNLDECSLEVLELPYQRYLVTIQPSKIHDILPDSPFMSVFQHHSPESFTAFNLNDCRQDAEILFAGMERESSRFRPYRGDYMISFLQQSLILAYRRSASQFASHEGRHSSHIYEVKKYLEEHYLEDIQIKDLAEQFYISVFYLSHSFKALTGYSPKQFLLMNRLSYAKDLLWNTNKPIAEIAVECGFGNSNNFIRAFKKHTGVAPGKFRSSTANVNRL